MSNSPKKKFSILTNLLKNNKSSSLPPLIKYGDTVSNSKQKADILNQHFPSKATVQGENDAPQNLCKFNVLSDLNNINNSPLEVGKLLRDLKKLHHSY